MSEICDMKVGPCACGATHGDGGPMEPLVDYAFDTSQSIPACSVCGYDPSFSCRAHFVADIKAARLEVAELKARLAVAEGGGVDAAELAEWQKSIEPASSEFSSWVDFMAEAEKKGADLCRSAASALVPVVALLFASFVVTRQLSGQEAGWMRFAAPVPLALWAVAGAGLVWELLPWEWSSVPADAMGIKREYLNLVERRKSGLRWIGVLVLVGIACAVGLIVVG